MIRFFSASLQYNFLLIEKKKIRISHSRKDLLNAPLLANPYLSMYILNTYRALTLRGMPLNDVVLEA